MRNWLLSGLLITSLSSVMAMEDTAQNREEQAERYLTANPPEAMFQSIAEKTSSSLAPDARQPYTDMLTKYLDMQIVISAMRSAMTKHFTAEELCALADFYDKPAAHSAMDKMSDYMADVVPVVQGEMLKAHMKAFANTDRKPATPDGQTEN